MLKKIKQHIQNKLPFLIGKKLLIAISGGVDSVVLTHLFYQLNFDISLAHCNFKLRDLESDLDENFVLDLGNRINIKTFTTQFNTQEYAKTQKLSIQLAARELRYNWFSFLIEKYQFQYLLTAHHANDNLETFLINLTRGTGLEGLTGIPQQNGKIIRPLLIFSRDEILQYATKNTIQWREDTTNLETKYIRNKIRQDIVPKLQELNPNLLHSFNKTSSFLKQSEQIINDSIEQISDEIIIKRHSIIQFNIEKIRQLSHPKAYLYQLLKNYGFTEWDDIYNLLFAQSGKQVFSKTHRLLKDRVFLMLSKIEENSNDKTFTIEENQVEVTHPVSLVFEKNPSSFNSNKNTIFVDNDLLTFPLLIRKWKKGDYFYPTGMQGSKKISKYFKDEKLSLIEKENIWLLCTFKNEIIWILNKRQDRRFIATKKTSDIIKISIS